MVKQHKILTHLYDGDLPDSLDLGTSVAVDSETMGLKPQRDRLCLLQLSSGDGKAHLVQFERGVYNAPNLIALFKNAAITKIFHYARFDVATIKFHLKTDVCSIFCTKIASKLVRTYTDRHGLKDLCKELLDIDLSKQQQSSDWGASVLSDSQKIYAATDVLYLHRIKEILEARLARKQRTNMAQECFNFIETRAALDLLGLENEDIFSHS